MNITIIGHGNIGGGLARAWRTANHAVTFGAVNPSDSKLVALCEEIGASARTIEGSADGADVVVLAMPYRVHEDVLAKLGSLSGQIVIDCTNAVGKGMKLMHGHDTSSAEIIHAKIPDAKLFKSFNAQGAENLVDTNYDGIAATNFFCGNGDASDHEIVRQLVTEVGFDAVDVGDLEQARLLEPLMVLWIRSSGAVGSRQVAFRLLRR